MVLKKLARSSQRIGVLSLVLMLVLTAAGLLLAQRSVDQIDRLRPQIAQLFTDALGAPVALGALSADWYGSIPRLQIARLQLFNSHGSAPLQLFSLRLELNLWQSLWHRSLVWRELSVESATVALREGGDGRWSLAGLPTREGSFNPRALLAPLAYSRFVQLSSLELQLQPNRGRPWVVEGTQLRVENEQQFHRLQATLGTAGQPLAPIQLVAEGSGDPLDREAFVGSGYLQLQKLQVAQPLAAIGMSLFPELFVDLQGLAELSVPLDGDLWFDLSQGGVLEFHGQLSAAQIPLDWLRDLDPLTNFRAALGGWYTPGQDWGVRLQPVAVSWAERSVEPFNMGLTVSLLERDQFALAFNQLQADLLVELLSDSGLLLPKWRALIDQLNPRGELGAVRVGRTDQGAFVSAQLRDFSVDSWGGVPAIRGLDAELELQGERAVLALQDADGLSLLLQPSYEQFIRADSANGLISAAWSARSGEVAVAGQQLRAAALGGSAVVDFYSHRADATSRADSSFELRVTAEQLRGEQWSSYLPATLPETLLAWLPTALQDPVIDQFELLVRRDRDSDERLSRSSQLAVGLAGGRLAFAPGWPAVDNLSGQLWLSDGELSGSFDRLSSAGLALQEASVSLPRGGRELTVAARAAAPLQSYMAYLEQTPLATPLAVLLDWRYSGRGETAINLQIPLQREPGSGVEQAVDYRVEAKIIDGQVDLQQPALRIEQLNGDLTISRDRGVVATALDGRLADSDLSLSLYRDIGGQRLRFDGALNTALLSALAPLQWPQLVDGSAALSGMLTLPPASSELPVRLTLHSDQVGLAYRLPAPLAKLAVTPRPLSADITFDREGQQLSIASAPLAAQLELRTGLVRRGVLNVGSEHPLPEPGKFLLAAAQPTLEWRPWRDWWQQLPATVFGALSSAAPGASDTAPLQLGFDLAVARVDQPYLNAEQFTASGHWTAGAVEFSFASSHYSGVGAWPYRGDTEQPITLALAELKIPAISAAAQSDSPPALNFAALPAINFSVQSLHYGQRALGELAFELRAEPELLRFEQLRGEILGVRLGGEHDAVEGGNQLRWHYGGDTPHTALRGGFASGDIAELFRLVGSEPIADSSGSYLQADLSWPGHPWQIDSQQLQGQLSVNLTRGQFYNRSGGGDTALRAISLFNFANWLRRLQFDFSDVFGDNLAYNQLSGSLQFDRGAVSLSPPLTAQLPSGTMALSAQLDLVERTVQGQLLATLPVATNLPWIVALVGGLPAAAGVYVTSKIMSKQLDRLSSISYTLNGPWDDIELAVDRVFARELEP